MDIKAILKAGCADKPGYYGGANVSYRFEAKIGRETLWSARNASTRIRRYFLIERVADGTPLEECPFGSRFPGDGGNPVYFKRHYGRVSLPKKWEAAIAERRAEQARDQARARAGGSA